jgi:hypothetical protein
MNVSLVVERDEHHADLWAVCPGLQDAHYRGILSSHAHIFRGWRLYPYSHADSAKRPINTDEKYVYQMRQ